jgi:hypothetical protein
MITKGHKRGSFASCMKATAHTSERVPLRQLNFPLRTTTPLRPTFNLRFYLTSVGRQVRHEAPTSGLRSRHASESRRTPVIIDSPNFPRTPYIHNVLSASRCMPWDKLRGKRLDPFPTYSLREQAHTVRIVRESDEDPPLPTLHITHRYS